MAEDKHKEIFGLFKIPDKALIKQLKEEISRLNTELGKERSYITEIEYELEQLRSLSSQELKEEKIRALVTPLNSKIKQQRKQLWKKKKDYTDLMNKYLTLNKQLDE